MPVAIVTDSAAALPRDLVAAPDISVVPMWLTVGDESVREGERDLGELLGDERVSTAAPAPGEFGAAIRNKTGSDGVLVLTIAASMSGTHNAAALAAEDVGGPVRVVDTRTAAGAEALVVLAAAAAAQAGGDLDTVEREAQRVIDRVRLVATVPTLDHLVRSGRVPGIAGWAGRRLNINPMFEFRGSKVHRLRPAIGQPAALDRIIGRFRRSIVDGARLHVTAQHALAADEARELLRRVEEEVAPATAFVGEFGSVMVVHTGPGLVGLAWWWEEPEPGSGADPTM
ncbi:MAG: DegV family protein [Acidimicrobiia bacterium]